MLDADFPGFPVRPTRRGWLAGGAGWLAATMSGLSLAQERPLLADVALPSVAGLAAPGGGLVPGFSAADLAGRTTLIVGFASWCGHCRANHRLMEKIAGQTSAPIFGVLTSDRPDAAAAFLRRLGDPYARIGDDPQRAFMTRVQAKGVPYALVVNPNLAIVERYTGELDAEDERDILSQLNPG